MHPSQPKAFGPHVSNAFTLIELLVVITIIVVLLALLTPALDKAIYQAELAVCGAQLHSVLAETQQYALDFKRYYPYRPELPESQTIEITEQGRGWDLRQIVQGYVRPNSLTCPLSGKVDIEGSKPDTTFVFGSYDYWAGWRYFGQSGSEGMNRIGDRFSCVQDGDGTAYTFNLLASDREVIGIQQQVQSSHPDRDGVLTQLVLQEADNYAWGLVNGTAAYGTITVAMWRNPTGHARGDLDRNFGYEDGSVTRLTDLGILPSGLPASERMVIAPHYSNANGYQNSSSGAAGAYYTAIPHD